MVIHLPVNDITVTFLTILLATNSNIFAQRTREQILYHSMMHKVSRPESWHLQESAHTCLSGVLSAVDSKRLKSGLALAYRDILFDRTNLTVPYLDMNLIDEIAISACIMA